MSTMTTDTSLRSVIDAALHDTPVTDIHTHLYAPAFGPLLLWGIDDLLTYHYLLSETFRWIDIPYQTYWAMSKREQADLVWKTLFIDHSPMSEACRGVLCILQAVGLDPGSRDLEAYRRYFAARTAEQYTDEILALTGVRDMVMTNDPFDDMERPVWEAGYRGGDVRFRAALRLDALLNAWPTAVPRLQSWGYQVDESLTAQTLAEVQRFLREQIDRMEALYTAVSLPPSFRMPEDSARGTLIAEAVLPVCEELDKPVGLMIGVKKLVNPNLKLAGDSVGKGDIDTVEYLCTRYPHNKFLLTMLGRDNQHELCVAARKYRNLLPFGCWWFLNTPLFIEEMSRMRLELLGTSMIPQHSDARVLDQLIYKWEHTRVILADVLHEKYAQVQATGWRCSEAEIRRDVADMLGGNFWRFLSLRLP